MKFNRLLNLIWMIMSTIYNKTTRKLPVVKVKGKGSATDVQAAKPSVHPEDATSTKMVHETLSHADAESGGNSKKINSATDTEILNVGSNSEQSHVALVGPNPEHMHDVFLATNYPKLFLTTADVPSTVTETTNTTSTLQPPRPPLQTYSSSRYLDHLKMEMEMEIPSVKASANSDIIFFFTSAQDGNKLLDDERLSLADDLKKAHDQNQNKSK
ncbi:hypothetical protein Tco_0065859 [Tanacetum coccineum]